MVPDYKTFKEQSNFIQIKATVKSIFSADEATILLFVEHYAIIPRDLFLRWVLRGLQEC